MEAPPSTPTSRVDWPAWLLSVAAVAAPLAVGSALLWAALPLAALVLTAYLGVLSRAGPRLSLGPWGWAALLALGVTALQLAPWPIAWVEHLAPEAAHAVRVAAELTGHPAPTTAPLTLDRARTAAAALTLLTFTLTFFATRRLARRRHLARLLLHAVLIAALATFLASLLHQLASLDAVWGLYHPVMTSLSTTPFPGPLINPNHAAALSLLGALLALQLALDASDHRTRYLLVAAVLGLGVLLTLSRANTLLLVAGVFVLTGLAARAPERRQFALRVAAAALVAGVAAVLLLGWERWAVEFSGLGGAEVAKSELVTHAWRSAAEVAVHAPFFGVGGGSFELAADGVIQDWSLGQLSFAHNAVLQVVGELGAAAGGLWLLLVLGGGVVTLRRLKGRARRLGEAGAVVALGAILVQNLVDFSLWIPGVGLQVVILAGVLTASTERDAVQGARRTALRRWGAGLAAASAMGGAGVWAWVDSPEAAKRSLRAEVAAELAAHVPEAATPQTQAKTIPIGTQTTQAETDALLREHPADYLVFGLSATLAERRGEPTRAKRLFERALALAPAEPTLLMARLRIARSSGDAAAALDALNKLANQRNQTGNAARLVAEGGFTEAQAAAFWAGSEARVLAGATAFAELGQAEAADSLLLWGIARMPEAQALAARLGDRRWEDARLLEQLATRCSARAGLADAAARAGWERLGALFQGRVEALHGRDARAYRLFEAAADAVPEEAVRPLLEAAKVAERMENLKLLGDAIARLSALKVVGAWPQGELHLLRSRAAELAGNLPAAIREMHEVLRFLDTVSAFHRRLAALFDKTHDTVAAERARARADALDAAAAARKRAVP